MTLPFEKCESEEGNKRKSEWITLQKGMSNTFN